MPELAEQTHDRAKRFIDQIAEMNIVKEELDNDIDVDASSQSDLEEQKPKFKQHCKGIKINAEFSKASDDKWKQLCIKNFDYIQMNIGTNKNPNISAAQLAT